MRAFRWYLSYIFPQRIADFSSPWNRHIRILMESGQYKLLVNGSRQSGAYIKKLWLHAFTTFGIPTRSVHTILVLGVGGGTVFHLLKDYFPRARVTAVDIDPMMFSIANQYFDLEETPRLTFIEADANTFIQRGKSHVYDLIIVDLFVGTHIPQFVLQEQFLDHIKRLLRPKGTIIINYLREREYAKRSDILLGKLQKMFQSVQEDPIYFNRFFAVTGKRTSLSRPSISSRD